MNPKLKILTGFLCFASICQLDAQEYRFELGAIGGVSSYMGEANTDHVLKNPRPAIGLIGLYGLHRRERKGNTRFVKTEDLLIGTILSR